ncbi:hypothetical protein [Paenibacillus pedocola]|uniref:hypothetical protein n=1 Tax=Paenibacillus pedocola TaxID=3242193 RepID=UPI0028776C32|nr:hypothetical protein [Paenibacillus typhae]
MSDGQGFTSGGKNGKIVIVSNFLIEKDFVNEIDLSFAGGTLLYLTKGGILNTARNGFHKNTGCKGWRTRWQNNKSA